MPKRNPSRSPDMNPKMWLANDARRKAVNALIEAHQEEYDRLLGDEREKHGLERVPNPPAPKLTKQQRIEKLLQQLEEAGIEPVV